MLSDKEGGVAFAGKILRCAQDDKSGGDKGAGGEVGMARVGMARVWDDLSYGLSS